MQLNCVNKVVTCGSSLHGCDQGALRLHMAGWMLCMTKMHVGYIWRSIRNATEMHTSYTWNIARNLNLKFIENSSTPWDGAVDQDWRGKLCAPKCVSQPPDGSMLALLSLPSQSGKGAL